MALYRDGNVCFFYGLKYLDNTIGSISAKFCTDIHGLLLSLQIPCRLRLSSEISQHVLNGLAQNFIQTFMVPR